MSFKKLNIPLKESLERLGITTPTPFQATILPKVKGGADVFGIAPEGSGKTTAMIINTMQKLKREAFDDSPRALIFVKDKKAALNGLALLIHAFGWVLPEPESIQVSLDVPDHVKDLAEKRWAAKEDKDWAESDRLRDAVLAEGWVIKDSKDGYDLEPS